MKQILLAILTLGLVSCAEDVAVRYHTYSDENVVYSENYPVYQPYYYPTYSAYPYYNNERIVIHTDSHGRRYRHHPYVHHQ